jgi:AcrR family transcriptional regulator
MGIPERKEREKEQRRKDILYAAEKIISAKGYWDTTMDDVAAGAELSKGTIYLYFKTKEELYYAITLRGLQILTDLSRKAAGNGKNGLEKVYLIGQAFLEFSKNYPLYFNALSYYEIKDNDFSNAESVVSQCDSEGYEALDTLIQAIRTGIRDGSIKPDIDPIKTAIILWGQSSGVIQLVALKGEHLEKRHGMDMSTIIEDAFRFTRCVLENK